MEALKKTDMVLIYEKPGIDAKGERIFFIHPKSTKGVLIGYVKALNKEIALNNSLMPNEKSLSFLIMAALTIDCRMKVA